MEYIKHKIEFYKKIDLKDLDKKELIKLITEAIEIEPEIIERRKTIPYYIERIQPVLPSYPTITRCNSNLTNFSNVDLVDMAKAIC